MSAKGRKRRSPGDGGIYPYETAAGTRYRINAVVQLPDGSSKRVFLRKGPNGERWTTPDEARAALRAILAESDKSGFTEPSQELLGTYGGEVIAGLRISDATRASYAKNWRLHVAPYPIGKLPLARETGQRLTAHYRVLEKSGRKDHRAGEPLSAADGPLCAPDHQRGAGPGRRGRADAGQPGAGREASHRQAGEGTGDALLDPGAARRVPGLVSRSTPTITRCGTCWPAPGCAGGKPSRCAGVTWTWTRAR